jgi:predicted nuclease of predicted toxin-antitoxin system
MPGVRGTLEHRPVRRRRVKLKLDENLGRRWAVQLRDAGHDVHTIWDEQLSGASDADVLAAAVNETRVLVTLDLDFANPIRFPPANTAGIAVLRTRDRAGRDDITALVDRLVRALDSADPSGHLWIVDRDRARQYEEPPE